VEDLVLTGIRSPDRPASRYTDYAIPTLIYIYVCVCRFVGRNNSVVYKVKLKFTLEHAMKAQRGSRGIALLFL
jgi:hypothetical protein